MVNPLPSVYHGPGWPVKHFCAILMMTLPHCAIWVGSTFSAGAIGF